MRVTELRYLTVDGPPNSPPMVYKRVRLKRVTYDSSEDENEEANNGHHKEDEDREGDVSLWHNVISLVFIIGVLGCNDPWESKAEENVYRVGAGDVTNGSISVF